MHGRYFSFFESDFCSISGQADDPINQMDLFLDSRQ